MSNDISTTTSLHDERESDRTQRATLIVYHPEGVETFPLSLDQPVIVGRASTCDVVVNNASLSREHARFVCRDDGVFVEDMKSTNGTKLNGVAINESRVRLADEVGLGEA